MLGNKALTLLVIAAALGIDAANAANVTRCDGTTDSTAVTVSGCDVFPCEFRRGTNVTIAQRFTPDHDIQTLTTKARVTVFLGIFQLPWSYPGVDGHSACDKIYLAADDSPAPCPLTKGVEYVYKIKLFVGELYPRVRANVNCGLIERGREITCYKVNIVIV